MLGDIGDIGVIGIIGLVGIIRLSEKTVIARLDASRDNIPLLIYENAIARGIGLLGKQPLTLDLANG